MAIPLDLIVKVNPGVLPAGGQALDLSGLALTQNAAAPFGQVLSFPTQAAVASYFGASSVEATAATNYFNGFDNATTTPGAMLFARYPASAIAGFLRGGSLANVTLTTLKTYTGVLTVTVAGTGFTSSTINLSAATSFSNAATIIQAAFTSPTFTVTFDSTFNAFVFTTNTTGATQTITAATGTLAANLKLDSTNATLSQGAAAADSLTFMNTVTAVNQNWASFCTLVEASATDKQNFAIWTNSQNNRFVYVCQDTDPNAVAANSTTTVGYYIAQNNLSGTSLIGGALASFTHACFDMAYFACLNFGLVNGRTTQAFRSQSGLTPTLTDATQFANAIANGYNVYSQFGSRNPANNVNFFYPGAVSGAFKWADTYADQMWLNANLQIQIANLLINARAIPYNASGYARIRGVISGLADQAVQFGAIRNGVELSPSQKQTLISNIGIDVSAALFRTGYYIQVADPGATVRAQRGSPIVNLYYTDGGSVQKITMGSIVIQ